MTVLSNEPHSHTSPFVSEETPNMAIILERVNDLGTLSANKRRDLKSAIRSFCILSTAGGVTTISPRTDALWISVPLAGERRKLVT